MSNGPCASVLCRRQLGSPHHDGVVLSTIERVTGRRLQVRHLSQTGRFKYEYAPFVGVVQSLVLAGGVLLLTVGVGILMHELSHAAVLSLFGVRCEIRIGPLGSGPALSDGITEAWAAVTPREMPADTSPWVVRTSAIAPLVLAVPLVAIAVGVVPDPTGADSPLLTALIVGWLACAIPSPGDFSAFWYAERAVAEHAEETRRAEAEGFGANGSEE